MGPKSLKSNRRLLVSDSSAPATSIPAQPTMVVATPPAITEPDPIVPPVEALVSPQFIIALVFAAILGMVLWFVFTKNELSSTQGAIAGSLVSGVLGAILGFYFGASKTQAVAAALTPPAKP